MKSKIIICFVFLLAIVISSGCVSQPFSTPDEAIEGLEDIEKIEGLWLGSLEFQDGTKLRILFNISANPGGSLNATIGSPDQGSRVIPADNVVYGDGKLLLEVASIKGAFEGVLKEEGETLEGEWKQGGETFQLTLNHIDEVPVLRRPQDPVRPYPYDEEEVVYENKEAGIKLAGTLTTPRTEGPFPAVLLITGSGKQNRDEEVLGHRPFLVLSDYLTRRGIAVLRVDDRGAGGSTGNFSQATIEDFAGDALAGVEYLKSRKEIDPAWIGLIGHSEGGEIAPMVAVRDPDVAFIVLMAGPGLNGEELSLLQERRIAEADGVPKELIDKNIALLEDIYSVLKKEEDDTIAGEQIRDILTDFHTNLTEEEYKYVRNPEAPLKAQVEAGVRSFLLPRERFGLTYDPGPTLMKVECPVLAINGEKDVQVPPAENLRAIEEALEAGDNEDYTVKELPGLNHAFQTAQTGSMSEYAKIEETMSPAALELIGDWISERTLETEELE
ncbi:alpha/beta hydrolase family protein [Methanosarcina sp. Mfa9]|uniref:alpha/beta hydrolase family protein n=1 Tax=Methanosarcina sp. Mfa9 TaxID=3439063 RepID=UPI003F82D955